MKKKKKDKYTKLIIVTEATHAAFKAYCAANRVRMSVKANEVLTDFLLKEAGVSE